MVMDSSPIKTHEDFRQYIRMLARQRTPVTKRSLEEYLRALWGLLKARQGEAVTFSLLGQLLHDAFLAEPVLFDEQWLQYDTPPNLDEEKKAGAFVVLQQMIWYQIADLHLMAQTGQIDDPNAFFGIDSPTGQRWYNFDPCSYLECAVAPPIRDGSRTQANWRDLAILLWLGQIYE
jgi:hypothetical protein